MMAQIILLILVFVATILGIAFFKRIGAARMLDIPNERSSHSAPTPRGAGIVLVAVCLTAYIVMCATTEHQINWGYLIGAIIVSAISWLDDVFGLPALVRFSIHAIAAALIIASGGSFNSVSLPFIAAPIDLGWFGTVLTFLWIVWLINAYNFMDGIDGIAGIQAVVAGTAWAILACFAGESIIFGLSAAIAVASIGFLVFNWAPASVFMGDVGSAFLGFTFAVIPLFSDWDRSAFSSWTLLAGIVFVWPFVFDAVLTFSRRLFKGEPVWIAHRQHLYQRLVQRDYAHSTVSCIYGLAGALVAAAFFSRFRLPGISDVLLLSSMTAVAAVIILLTAGKKV